jgi:hypothetical protein
MRASAKLGDRGTLVIREEFDALCGLLVTTSAWA